MSTTQHTDTTDEPGYLVTMHVTGDHEESLLDGIDYLRDRLLGEIPPVLTDFAAEISRVVWEGYARDGIPVQLVRDDGTPFEELPPRTPEDEAEEEAAVAAYFAHLDTPEGRAEQERADRLADFREAHAAETADLYRGWLESRAQLFRRARRDWHRAREAALIGQFEAYEIANATVDPVEVGKVGHGRGAVLKTSLADRAAEKSEA